MVQGTQPGPQRLEGRQWSSHRGRTAALQHPEPRKQDLPPHRGHSMSSQSLPTLSNDASTPGTIARLRTRPAPPQDPCFQPPLWGHTHVNAQGTARARGPPYKWGPQSPTISWFPSGCLLASRALKHAQDVRPSIYGEEAPSCSAEASSKQRKSSQAFRRRPQLHALFQQDPRATRSGK